MFKYVLVFLTAIFLSLNYGALLYVNSSYLEGFFSKSVVSLLYLGGAAWNIVLFVTAPKILRMFRKEWALIFSLVITTLATLGLALGGNGVWIAASFVIYSSYLSIAYYYLDIALEEISLNHHTGSIRGLYYSFLNAGLASGPLLVSIIIKGDALRPIYLIGTFILCGAIVCALFLHSQPWRPIHHKHQQSLSLPLRAWWRSRNVRAVTLARLVLEMFFSLMTIFVPIYLHETLGFTWSELGIIFTIMLLPFVLLEWPAGEVADRWWGEKEIMTFGFFLTGSMLLLMPFLGRSFSAWLVVLLVSRVGASLVEVTTESYFFKKISAEDTSLLSIFRLTRPVSIMLGALIGALTLNFFSFEKLFFVIAVVIFFGMKESLHLKDTL